MKKILLILPVVLLLATGCNSTNFTESQTTASNNCEAERSRIVSYLEGMDTKTKQAVPDTISNKSTIKEIFYSPKLKKCVYTNTTDKTFKTGSRTLTYTLRDADTGSVLIPAGITYPEKSDYQTRVNEFNQDVQPYR